MVRMCSLVCVCATSRRGFDVATADWVLDWRSAFAFELKREVKKNSYTKRTIRIGKSHERESA